MQQQCSCRVRQAGGMKPGAIGGFLTYEHHWFLEPYLSELLDFEVEPGPILTIRLVTLSHKLDKISLRQCL